MSADSPPITTMSSAVGLLDGLNATLDSSSDAAPARPGVIFPELGLVLLELKLLFGALGIIYLGAHAALRRPPSASPAKHNKTGSKTDDEDGDNDKHFSQGLELADAIFFPVIAAVTLVSLYYLIKWLKDPSILNRILRWYMSAMSTASLLTLYTHGAELVTSFVFPRYWRGRDGSLRRIDQVAKTVTVCDDVGNAVRPPDSEMTPLPGPFSLLALSTKACQASWKLRSLLTRRWVFKFLIPGVVKKGKLKFAHMMAMIFALATALAYFSLTSVFLSNVLGYGMCYGTLLVLSPTDFLTGALVLIGLFFYDIFMVFYTPYMITVATELDVPIKLTFESAGRKSILGLGDIIIPGMVIAWALRFDLYMHYLCKVKYELTKLTILAKDVKSGESVSRSETKHKMVKAQYVNVKGKWGEWLWTRGSFYVSRPQKLPVTLEASAFPKTYFYASLVGYTLGMLCTLAMLVVFKRGQPVLLYLVPGVLGSLLVVAVTRGEMRDIWKYTEDGSLDTVDVVVDLDVQGRTIRTLGKVKNGLVDLTADMQTDKKHQDQKSSKKTLNGEGKVKSPEPADKDGSKREGHPFSSSR